MNNEKIKEKSKENSSTVFSQNVLQDGSLYEILTPEGQVSVL